MHLDPWTLGLQAVNALVLVWLLSRLLFRPVSALIAERQATVAQALATAAAAEAGASALAAEATQARQALQLELEQARSAASQSQAAAARAAQQALDQALHARMQAGESELASLRAAARHAGQQDALAFSLDLARRLLQRLPDDALVMPFVPGLAQSLAQLPAPTLAGWCASAEPAELRSARPLRAAELSACRQALQQVLGTAGTLPPLLPVVDAELLAGLELAGAHLHVVNHLQRDWQALCEALREATGD